jgi:hypothetical protein
MTKDELIAENARMREVLRQIAFKMCKRKMLKDPPPAADYWSNQFCAPKEWAAWVEDIGELARQALEEKE